MTMSDEDRSRRYRRVLNTVPADPCRPFGRQLKQPEESWCPTVQESVVEEEDWNPWSAPGPTGMYGSGQTHHDDVYFPRVPRAPLERTYLGRDSVVRNYRVPVSHRSSLQPAIVVPLNPQSPPPQYPCLLYTSPSPRD